MEKPEPPLSTASNECQEPPPEVESSELAAIYGRPPWCSLCQHQDRNAEVTSPWMEKLTLVQTLLEDMAAKHHRWEKRLEECLSRQEILDRLSEANCKYQERHHERHVMAPLMNALIRVADRCREQIENGQSYSRKRTLPQDHVLGILIHQFLSARRADLEDVESRLADYEVMPYSCPGETFNPAEQKMVDKIAHQDPGQNHKVACRHRPGYRRNSTIIRPEHVSVYVVNPTPSNEKEI